MDLKRVDNKPMDIRKIEKSNLRKKSLLKKSSVGTSSTETERRKNKGLAKFKTEKYQSDQSVKRKNASAKIGNAVQNEVLVNQLEGGEELKQAAMVEGIALQPVTDATKKGAELFKQKAIKDKKNKLRIVRPGQRLTTKNKNRNKIYLSKQSQNKYAKKDAMNHRSSEVDAATNKIFHRTEQKKAEIKNNEFARKRKIQFFLDKMKQEEQQQDSAAKVAKDLMLNQFFIRSKQAVAMMGGILASIGGAVALVVVPVVLFLALIYNSPFAIFFPPLEEGDTVTSVTSAYVAEFNQTVTGLANEHIDHDRGEVVYIDYEGAFESPTNYYDILAVYMVKYGVGDTATIVDDTTRNRIKTIVDDMCSYSTGSEMVETVDESGNKTSEKVLKVKVALKSYRDMISLYGFQADEVKLLEEMMSPDNLILLGYTGYGDGSSSQSSLSVEEIAKILSSITDTKQRSVCTYALNKVGYPYSQAYRDSGNYYDCSSLAYYSWLAGGKNISYGGSTTAASEAQGLSKAGKTVSYNEMEPGDLIFFSYTSNGRFMNISHVAIYVGNGKVVEAKNEKYGVVYGDVSNINRIVMIGRP